MAVAMIVATAEVVAMAVAVAVAMVVAMVVDMQACFTTYHNEFEKGNGSGTHFGPNKNFNNSVAHQRVPGSRKKNNQEEVPEEVTWL